jgi:hypothetical protein
LILKYLIIAVEFVKEQEGKANEQVKWIQW